MAKGQKRTERLAINLTPTQQQHLAAIAAEEDTRASSYVYELICQSLNEHPSMKRAAVSNSPSPESLNQLGELYGILDGLKETLEEQAGQHEHHLLQSIKEQIESVQKTLSSLHSVQTRERS